MRKSLYSKIAKTKTTKERLSSASKDSLAHRTCHFRIYSNDNCENSSNQDELQDESESLRLGKFDNSFSNAENFEGLDIFQSFIIKASIKHKAGILLKHINSDLGTKNVVEMCYVFSQIITKELDTNYDAFCNDSLARTICKLAKQGYFKTVPFEVLLELIIRINNYKNKSKILFNSHGVEKPQDKNIKELFDDLYNYAYLNLVETIQGHDLCPEVETKLKEFARLEGSGLIAINLEILPLREFELNSYIESDLFRWLEAHRRSPKKCRGYHAE